MNIETNEAFFPLVFSVALRVLALCHIYDEYLSLKDRNGLDLTEAEDIKKRCKNTQKNCTKKIFMTQIIMMM